MASLKLEETKKKAVECLNRGIANVHHAAAEGGLIKVVAGVGWKLTKIIFSFLWWMISELDLTTLWNKLFSSSPEERKIIPMFESETEPEA